MSPPSDSWRGTLPDSIGSRADPSWSPDGREIAWVVVDADRDRAQLIAVDTTSGDHRLLWEGEPDLRSWPAYPRWSPDGERIVFAVFQSSETELWALRDFLTERSDEKDSKR